MRFKYHDCSTPCITLSSFESTFFLKKQSAFVKLITLFSIQACPVFLPLILANSELFLSWICMAVHLPALNSFTSGLDWCVHIYPSLSLSLTLLSFRWSFFLILSYSFILIMLSSLPSCLLFLLFVFVFLSLVCLSHVFPYFSFYFISLSAFPPCILLLCDQSHQTIDSGLGMWEKQLADHFQCHWQCCVSWI